MGCYCPWHLCRLSHQQHFNHCRSCSQSCSNSQVSQICQSYVYSHFRTICYWDLGCVECSGHWVDPRNWQTHNSCHGWSTRDHSPLSTSFHCHPAGKCSLFYEHIQIWVRAISIGVNNKGTGGHGPPIFCRRGFLFHRISVLIDWLTQRFNAVLLNDSFMLAHHLD